MNQIRVVWFEEIKESFFSRKMIFAVAISVLIMLSFYAFAKSQFAYFLTFMGGGVTTFLIKYPIAITYYLLFLTIPLFSYLLGHDYVSSEVEGNHVRGIVSKVSRNNFIIGKFLSLFTIISVLSFLLLLLSAIYIYTKVAMFDIVHVLTFMLYLIPYIAATCAVTIFFSSLSSRSSTALFISILFYVVSFYASIKMPYIFASWFLYINNIIYMDVILPVSVFLGYFVLFMVLSIIVFRARDL